MLSFQVFKNKDLIHETHSSLYELFSVGRNFHELSIEAKRLIDELNAVCESLSPYSGYVETLQRIPTEKHLLPNSIGFKTTGLPWVAHPGIGGTLFIAHNIIKIK